VAVHAAIFRRAIQEMGGVEGKFLRNLDHCPDSSSEAVVH
jgi:hypothetical protein